MTTTQFPVALINSYIVEILGNAQYKNPLLLKNLSQKTKYNLKKLGDILREEQKNVYAQVMDLRTKYSEKIKTPEGKDELEIKEEFKEQFLKEATELENMKIPIIHYPFVEADFIDKSTGDVVGAEGIYYNIIDILIYETNPQ